jgi:hypothetical protein
MLKSNSNPQIDTSPEIRRVGLYGRVRTTKDQNPEMQLREPREYAGCSGWQVARLCSEGLSWAEVCRHTGLSKETAQRAAQSVSEAVFTASAAESCLEVR